MLLKDEYSDVKFKCQESFILFYFIFWSGHVYIQPTLSTCTETVHDLLARAVARMAVRVFEELQDFALNRPKTEKHILKYPQLY